MIVTAIIFCIGLALLVKGADAFVAGGGGLAIRHRVSPALIGFTVIAFGTSLPELVVSVNAAATGNGAIALGNVLGSNVANIALVLALCTLIKPEMMLATPESRAGLLRHTGLMLAATAVFAVLALRGVLDALAGVVLLAVFAGTLTILWRERKEVDGDQIETHGKRDILFIALGLAAVVIGSQLVLMGALDIADAFGIPAFVVGMSMVAFGTSLPELATSIIAAVRNQGAISSREHPREQHLQSPPRPRSERAHKSDSRRIVHGHPHCHPLLGGNPPADPRLAAHGSRLVGDAPRRVRRIHRLALCRLIG